MASNLSLCKLQLQQPQHDGKNCKYSTSASSTWQCGDAVFGTELACFDVILHLGTMASTTTAVVQYYYNYPTTRKGQGTLPEGSAAVYSSAALHTFTRTHLPSLITTKKHPDLPFFSLSSRTTYLLLYYLEQHGRSYCP